MKRTVSGAPDVQSPMNPGQIEQVVSSADCRQVEPRDSQNGGHRALQANIRDGETAGTARLDANQLPFDDPPLSLEDLVALVEDFVFGQRF